MLPCVLQNISPAVCFLTFMSKTRNSKFFEIFPTRFFLGSGRFFLFQRAGGGGNFPSHQPKRGWKKIVFGSEFFQNCVLRLTHCIIRSSNGGCPRTHFFFVLPRFYICRVVHNYGSPPEEKRLGVLIYGLLTP